MHTENVLLVWYSRTGATKTVAEAIARECACDVEEIVDMKRRTGPLAWLRARLDARAGRLTIIRTVRHHPGLYDLVVIGTPVWSRSLPPAVRTYLVAHRQELHRVAFFCTYDDGGSRRVLEQMSALAGHAPIDVLALRRDAIGRGEHVPRVREFVDTITGSRAAA